MTGNLTAIVDFTILWPILSTLCRSIPRVDFKEYRFEWWGEYARQLGCHGDIRVLDRQSGVYRREHTAPRF